MRFAALVLLRLAVATFCLLTAGYGVLNCSAFAFDMFIRPQLFPWIGQFVAWHHLWLAGAYFLSVISVWPELDWRPARAVRDLRGRAAHWLAVAYAVVFGAVVWWQLASPHLPTLWNDQRALPTTLVALLPLVWLAAIDHVSVPQQTILDENAAWQPIGQRRLLMTSAGVAGYLWFIHVLRTLSRGDLTGGVAVWVVTGLWTLTLTLATFALVYTSGWLIESVAALTRARRTAERLLVIAAASAVAAAFLRRAVFPTLSLQAFDGWVVAACAGAAVALSWSGLARRRIVPATRSGGIQSSGRAGMIAAAGAMLLPPVSLVALGLVERVDWAFVGQRFIVVSAWALTFSFALGATRSVVRHDRAFSPWQAVVPPVAVLVVLLVMPRAVSTLATWRGDGRFEPTVAFERHAAADVAFQLVSNLFVARKGFDAEYYRFLHTESNFSGAASVTVPVVDLAASLTPARRRRPDIFVIALDSLRRDYLSPYNAAVSFTPAIESLAADGFVFENAFTRHGGTELAIPSIWAGGMLVRQVRVRGFERVNAFEKLVNTEGYRILINDFTIAQNLLPSTPVTRLNPGVPSADTDLCGNLEALQSELDAAGPDAPPVFGYLSPMNVHILNTQRNRQRSLDGDYPGFFAPYASRLRRIDTCLGRFVSYLKQTNRYDESIIVITSDHGDSLGENGHWGHATWLPPEVVRIPLIVKIPASARSTLTTDLARLAFSTDIAPTLYALLGHPVRDLGPLFGAPLFVPSGDDLRDRRRGSFLLTASYGATYGLLRRNGRGLYVTDLVERREFAYDLSRGVVGAETTVDHGLRQVNQREIRGQVAEIARFFKVTR